MEYNYHRVIFDIILNMLLTIILTTDHNQSSSTVFSLMYIGILNSYLEFHVKCIVKCLFFFSVGSGFNSEAPLSKLN